MKILQVIPVFTSVHGGSFIVAYYLSEELSKRGHEVIIITTDFGIDEEYVKAIEKSGVKVVVFKCAAHFGSFLISPGMKKWLNKEIQKFDVIHLQSFRSYQNNVTHHYAKKYGIPYLLQAQGSVPRIVEKKILKIMYDVFYGHRILRDADKAIAVSKAEVEHYRQMGVEAERIVIMPNAINIESFRDTPELGQFKSKYQISGKYMVLFLGRIHKQKGIDFLIRAFSRLAKEIGDAALVIIGPDCGYEKETRILANTLNLRNKVIFPGWMDEEDKLSAYTDADVVVYPSIFENYGLVPLEAIMCGTPVIVADDCGCGELIKKMGAGYLVKYGDLESLKKRMIRALKNSDETARMVEKGRRYIQENLVWGKVAVKVEQLYEKMS
jgi:glycosyltransferase involved in cell wall biosynthesis